MQFEYPLQWPPQQSKTKNPKRSRFGNVSIHKASQELFNELKLLGAKDLVISTNLKQKMKGDGFYSNQIVDDVGIAIYSNIKGDNKVMACDKWDRVEHNIWALVLSIRAIRGLERWGGSEFLDGLFTGFKALPQNAGSDTNYFDGIENIDDLKTRYRRLAHKLHPDMPTGDFTKFVQMKTQYQNLLSKLEK